MSITEPSPVMPAVQSLVARLRDNHATAALTFAGQGADPLAELSALVRTAPALRPLLEGGALAVQRAAAEPALRDSGLLRHGFDVAAWLDDPDGAPDADYLRSAPVSAPLVLLAQALLWEAARTDGLHEAVAAGAITRTAGHSLGLLGALLVAEAPEDAVDDARLARYLRIALGHGVHALAATPAGASARPTAPATPMAAVGGVRHDRLAAVVARLNHERLRPQDAVRCALVNTRTRTVVSGPPAALTVLRDELERLARDEEAAQRAGRRGGSPLRFTWSPLPVDVPYHALSDAAAVDFAGWLRGSGLLPVAPDLELPVLSGSDARDLRAHPDLAAAVAAAQLRETVRWDLVCGALAAGETDWVLDLGPGTAVAHLTAENLRGSGVRTLGLASPEGRRRLVTAGAVPAGRDLEYAAFAPSVVELPDGRRHVETRYTQRLGRPPIVLAGMTPTTTDAPIVAAAVNAGYTAELAGGGQPDRWTLHRRLAELEELLEPGRELVFNTLLLDRHLWDLHVEGAALVPQARAAGAPLAGLTVSAGIPDADEAIALLDRLTALGMHANAFKPGTREQVGRVLAIADAAPHHLVCVQLEGGRGGGHHSWEDLQDLLLDTYDDLRRRANVVLCVAGGIATPAEAADLLTGAWSVAHGEPAMPVDAVLLGTVAMACREAAASPAVKAALVAAPGSAEWVPRRAVDGGVTSARSNLNADIHLLDNAAARTAHLLESVAGDAAAVAERADEIVAALATTAKPYLGDLRGMTYLETVEALTARLATGRGGRYDDGAWGHPSWRERALLVYRRFAARLDPVDEGVVVPAVGHLGDLDDPAAALSAFAAAYPDAGSTLLDPADVAHVLAVCDGPGKPVPFVPVLDGEVRRWYMADALWQAQDDRLGADGVFVIPGPHAVAGITRADEPVADLLRRFEDGVLDALGDDAQVAVRDRLATEGPRTSALARLAGTRSGVVAGLCVAPTVVADGTRTAPNPLLRLIGAEDELELDEAPDGTIERLVARCGSEQVVVSVAPDDASVVLVTASDAVSRSVSSSGLFGSSAPTGSSASSSLEADPSRYETPGGLQLRFRALGDGRFAALDSGAALAAYAAGGLGVEPLAPGADPFGAGVRAAWACPAGLAASYGALTGAAHRGVPLDLAFTLAWPALGRLLGSPPLAAHLSALLHAEHAVTPLAAWPPRVDEAGTVVVRVVAVEDPADAPTTVRCRAHLAGERGPLADVETVLIVRTPGPVFGTGAGAWSSSGGIAGPSSAADGTAGPSAVAPATPDRPDPHASAADDDQSAPAPVTTGPSSVASATPNGPDPAPGPGPGVDADRPRTARPALVLARAEDVAPDTGGAFARVGGDHNPLHRSVLSARLAGIDRPVVHGAWTAARAGAFLVDAVCGGDPARVRSWHVRFVAPVFPHALLDLTAERVGVRDGRRVVAVRVEADGVLVAAAEAEVLPEATALVFPGQGVQRPGLGSESRDRSRAARAVWDRADRFLRSRFGVPLLDVVERNPAALRRDDGTVVRHPEGVLFRTELTQPALVALAAAQSAELTDAGVVSHDGPPVAAGHSVGEFSALVALGVLDLEAALELVYRRGEAMQRHVPRDAAGRSAFGLAVVDPSRTTDLDPTTLAALVADIAQRTGAVLEIVNHNALGQQYAVAGDRAALDALVARVGARAVLVVPGIDVPFHSSVLQPAVADLRTALEDLVGAVDHRRLVDRWVPNLVGRPFTLEPAFVADVAARTGEAFDAAAGPDDLARGLLIALLAHQLAAPVQWINSVHALTGPAATGGLGVTRIVEVGPAAAPVLTGLTRATLAHAGGEPPAVILHSELDRTAVLDAEEPPVEVEVDAGLSVASDTGRPPAAPSVRSPASGGGETDGQRARSSGSASNVQSPTPGGGETDGQRAGSSGSASNVHSPTPGGGETDGRPAGPAGAPARPVADQPLHAGLALRLALAAQARVRPDQLDGSETIDQLFQGVSSRRNQVLIDIGRELALSGAEGVQRQTVGELVEALAAHASYRFPGPYLREVMAAGLSRALGRSGLGRPQAAQHLSVRWGLGPGLTEQALAVAALESREGASARGGPLGRLADDLPASPADARTYLDGAVALLADDLGIVLRPFAAAAPSASAAVDPAALTRVEQAVRAAAHDLVAALDGDADDGAPPTAPADDAAADRARLAVLDAELGTGRADEVAPAFDARRHVRFDDAGATARWDLVRAYHAALDDRLDRDGLTHAVAQLALHGADPVLTGSALHLAERAAQLGRPDVAVALRAAAVPRATPLPPAGLGADGSPDAARPADLLDRLVAAGHEHLAAALASALETAPDLRDERALVTGASPGSIGAALVRHLLRSGATVVVTTSTDTAARRRWYRDLYRAAAAPGAVLHVLPANLGSFADVDALAAWLREPGGARRGRPELALDPLPPTLVAPFAALPTAGDLDTAGAASEAAVRLQLLGVQRLIGALAADASPGRPPAVLLPLSPNHGTFGGDGIYSETKAALEVALRRWHAEQATWGGRVRLLAPRIGWVRGTGLMGANDPAARTAEAALGIRTLTADEMGWLLTGLLSPAVRTASARAPYEVDLTGGLADATGAGGLLGAVPTGTAGSTPPPVAPTPSDVHLLSSGQPETDVRPVAEPEPALPGPLTGFAVRPRIPPPPAPTATVDGTGTGIADTGPVASPRLEPRDLVVIVGTGELGPGGSARTRAELERGGPLSPRAVVELAWACGLVRAERDRYAIRWVDAASGAVVAEGDLAGRYRDAVRGRIGLRPLHDDGVLDPEGFTVLATVPLDRELRFEVAGREEAETFLAADPERTRIAPAEDGGPAWTVTQAAGSLVRVPRTVPHTRRTVGQLPDGLDLGLLGVPDDLLATADRMALVNLACSDAAFQDAGLTPEQLLTGVHPALVANTQGAGMGGMASLRRLLLDHLLGRDRQTDRLQESLGNVVAAHVVQGYVGSYGSMVHPVAACATAAVSLEEAHDMIRLGKADAVLAGGYDDLTPEGMHGFADMGATADGAVQAAAGLDPAESSRPNDLRRSGFVEAQGGGALLCVRGDVALDLGLPVRGVLLHAQSTADGIHASIPAPGMGILATALGGPDAPLARALGRHGLTVDDIGIVSKHDTSTEMNDPNEADLHERMQAALGRTPGRPLLVVSQKAVTGHAKGGAAAWQVAGALQAMAEGIVPGNPNLESVDPLVAGGASLTLGDTTLRVSAADPVRAAVVTSLGFGHVSALVAVAHPDVFLDAVPPAVRDEYRTRAARRRADGERARLERMLGDGEDLRRSDRRFGGGGDGAGTGEGDAADRREAEAALLLDPDARLGDDGRYPPRQR
ncbi:hypothetical protein DSM112329_05081 [Paraconexibacter sp. AEG42_29]|uniref:Ketosynthase family 3 (KS3) domain-containing protein n=1 Tax=Paraconexibacter sp. AEG42_29 TaxID=2997339 RepID=A0AAU7B2J4_9ACTN